MADISTGVTTDQHTAARPKNIQKSKTDFYSEVSVQGKDPDQDPENILEL
jgi:hypothetical protein